MDIKKNETGAIRRRSPAVILRRELDRALSGLAAGGALLNMIYLFLSCVCCGKSLAQALCVPVCSLLILCALAFLKNAAIEYFNAGGRVALHRRSATDGRPACADGSFTSSKMTA